MMRWNYAPKPRPYWLNPVQDGAEGCAVEAVLWQPRERGYTSFGRGIGARSGSLEDASKRSAKTAEKMPGMRARMVRPNAIWLSRHRGKGCAVVRPKGVILCIGDRERLTRKIAPV